MISRLNILNIFKTSAVLAALLFGGNIFSQIAVTEPTGSKGEPIELEYADSLLGARDDAGHVRRFMGNVRFAQGKVVVRSDIATHYINENRAELIGNVVITQDDMTLKAPRADYNGNTGVADAPFGIEIRDKNVKMKADKGFYSTITYIADFYGNVVIKDDTVTIRSDTLQYHRQTKISYANGNVIVEDDSTLVFADIIENERDTRKSYAYGNVIVRGKYQNTALTADTIIHLPNEYYTYAYGSPALFQIDTVFGSVSDSLYVPKDSSLRQSFRLDTLTVASDTMTAFRYPGDERYYFSGNVEIVRGNVAASAHKSIFFSAEERIELAGIPVVWYDSTQLHADSIIIYIPEKKLSLIWARRNAFAGTRDEGIDTTRTNQLSGEEIKLIFERDSIRAILGWGDAKSLYFLADNESKEGAARNSADTVQMNFDLGEIDEIIWLGGVQGEFFPENIIENSILEYYLPAFRWRTDKPRKRHLIEKNKYIYSGVAK